MNNIIINLPQNIKIVVWKNKKLDEYFGLYLYNKDKKFNFYTNFLKNELKIDKNSNTIIMYNTKLNYETKKLSNMLFNFLKSWNIYYFNKIKFKGKGFRMRFFKKNKFVKFFFGKSHKTFILFKKIIMKKINKYKFILKSIKKGILNKNSGVVVNIKPLNFYTLRGLRLTRQTIYKRKGKKGTYI